MDSFNAESRPRIPVALIVDDCDHTRLVCLTALDRVGYQVYQTSDVALAMKWLTHQAFGFLVVDFQTVLRQDCTLPEILSRSCVDLRVALLTPHPALVPKVMTTKLHHILYKPINPTLLMTCAVQFKDTLQRRESQKRLESQVKQAAWISG